MIRKLILLTVLLAITSVIHTGCGSDKDEGPTEPPPPVEPRLIADAHQDPTLDNALDSPVWDSIEVLSVQIGHENAYNANQLYVTNKFVDMKALVADDSLLYIWASWKDNDEDNRFGQLRASWTMNDKVEWGVHYPDDTSEAAFNEDRFYIIFDNDGTNGADCAAFCHDPGNESADDRLFYGAAGDDADVWHWKANRTGLAKLSDDMHMTTTKVAPDPQDQPSDFLYEINYTILQNQGSGSYIVLPKKMHETGENYTGPGLLESEITDVSGLFTDFVNGEQWITFLPPPSQPVGKSVPGYLIYDESGRDGSRWDVSAVSAHDGTGWTVVFRRALTTADAADVDFGFSSLDSVEVTIGVTNNSGIEHYGRKPFYIVFP